MMKKWWQSKTIWGAIAVLIGVGMEEFGYTVSPDEQEIFLAFVSQIFEVFGGLLALWGRISATKFIG